MPKIVPKIVLKTVPKTTTKTFPKTVPKTGKKLSPKSCPKIVNLEAADRIRINMYKNEIYKYLDNSVTQEDKIFLASQDKEWMHLQSPNSLEQSN